jgi:mono/diheme cytochrome c family protein
VYPEGILICENGPVKALAISAILLASCAIGAAQTPDAQTAVNAGAVVFRDNCARCHGADLAGGKKAPALAEINKKKHSTDDRITNRILNGEGKMPPFRESLSDAQIKQLIAYLRADNRPTPPPAPAQN